MDLRNNEWISKINMEMTYHSSTFANIYPSLRNLEFSTYMREFRLAYLGTLPIMDNTPPNPLTKPNFLGNDVACYYQGLEDLGPSQSEVLRVAFHPK
jgi:hypothetical protein